MERVVVCLLGLFICQLFISTSALTLSTYINAADKERLKNVFLSPKTLTDVLSAHYATLGLKLLGTKPSKPQDYCDVLKSKLDQKNLESIFNAVLGSKALGNCQIALTTEGKAKLESAISDDATVQDLYYAVLSLKNLGAAIDSAKVSKALTAALKKDDSVLNLGYAFHVASHLSGDLTSFTERIEDAVVQADEINGEVLQFEGGLSITAIIVSGIYRLSEAAKKEPSLTGEQALKFTNYFLTRKNVQAVKGAALLLDMLVILTTNKYHIPVSVGLTSQGALSKKTPTVVIQVTNVLGASLGTLSVILDSATRVLDEQVVLQRKPFHPSKTDNTQYVLNFMESKPGRGFYNLSVTATPSTTDSRLIGNTGAVVQIKVLTEVEVVNFEIGTVDRDQTTSPKTEKVQFGGKLSNVLEADYHQKLLVKFSLKDKANGDIMSAHQAFVHLQNEETKREIVFVAEPDSSVVYRFDLDLQPKAKDFGYLSGKYSLSLIIGDAVIANPVKWTLATLQLTFPPNPTPTKEKENPYALKPEIKHLFREQEKRPPPVLSNTFCGLILAPLLLLFILWGRIGVNLSNFPLSLSSILFHLGVGGILTLFFFFWLQLNMFTTLKYLAGLGVVTFITGHGMLSRLTHKK